MGVPYVIGDVFAAVGSGQIRHYSPLGVLKNTLVVPASTPITTGMAFDKRGHLFVTLFSTGDAVNHQVAEFDDQGNFVSYFATGYSTWHFPESIVINTAGDFYIGQASTAVNPGNPLLAHILKFNAAGVYQTEYAAATETRGTDWTEIAECGDQCVLFYTSEGRLVKRYNVCNDTQMADFVDNGPTAGRSYALRVLPTLEVLSCTGAVVIGSPPPQSSVYLYSATGVLEFTYIFANSSLFALNIDPDRQSFWTADINTGAIYHLNLPSAGGNLITSWVSPPASGGLGGLAVYGERQCFDDAPQIYRRVKLGG